MADFLFWNEVATNVLVTLAGTMVVLACATSILFRLGRFENQ